MKNLIKILLKFSIAALLISWLISSGKLDFSLVKKAFAVKYLIPGILCIHILNIFITSVRWRFILHTQSKKLKVHQTFALNWIGCLFNTVLPGAVSGDFIKLIYAKSWDKSLTRGPLLSSVLLDRVLGLLGLLILQGIFSGILIFLNLELSGPLQILYKFNLMLLLLLVFFLLSFFLPQNLQNKIYSLLGKVPYIGNGLSKSLQSLWTTGKNHTMMLKSVALTMIVQLFNMSAFYLLIYNFMQGGTIGLFEAFTIIPIGLISVAIPITPAGIGTGHLVFDQLFQLFHITNGADLFNLYFISTLMTNLLGLFPYAFFNKEKIPVDEEALA